MLGKCSNLLLLSHIQVSTLDGNPQQLPSFKTSGDLRHVRGVEGEEKQNIAGETKSGENYLGQHMTRQVHIVSRLWSSLTLIWLFPKVSEKARNDPPIRTSGKFWVLFKVLQDHLRE